jgi:hypothetical protein
VNTYAVWFRWAVVLGVLQDWFFALPGIFMPNAVLGFVGAEPAVEPVWPAFASLILILLSLFYLPGAVAPFRYLPNALLAVVARAAGVVFFFWLYPGRFPPLFGYIDLALTVLQGGLLVLALREGPAPETP